MNETEKMDQLTKKIDELCNINPSQVILDIGQYKQKHLAMVLKKYPRFVKQFEVVYDVIVRIVYDINYIDKSKWPGHRSAQFLLMTYNLKSLYSSFDRLVKGFYEDSFILARPVYEAFIKIIYITCYSDNPYYVISGIKEKKDSRRKFNLTNFLKDELKIDWHSYRLFSAITHSNWYSVLGKAIEIKNGQREAVALEFKFDQKLLEVGINDITFLLLAFLKTIICLFATGHDYIFKKDILERAKSWIALTEEAHSLHPKPYWPRVIRDIKDIFEMIKEVESGKNWKKSWKNIRTPRENK